jgi:hypothetical protein
VLGVLGVLPQAAAMLRPRPRAVAYKVLQVIDMLNPSCH